MAFLLCHLLFLCIGPALAKLGPIFFAYLRAHGGAALVAAGGVIRGRYQSGAPSLVFGVAAWLPLQSPSANVAILS